MKVEEMKQVNEVEEDGSPKPVPSKIEVQNDGGVIDILSNLGRR